MLQFHEAQCLQHARVDLIGQLAGLFHQPVGHVLFDRHRIEERALLEDHADVAAELKEVLLAHFRHFLAEDRDAAGIGFDQSQAKLQDQCFPGACHAH